MRSPMDSVRLDCGVNRYIHITIDITGLSLIIFVLFFFLIQTGRVS